MKILKARQMQDVDRRTTEEYGVPSLILMENAGFNLFQELERRFENLGEARIAILCGKGNNGGDGMVLARQLAQREIPADLFLLASSSDVSGDARVNLDILIRSGHPLFEITSEEAWAEVAQNFDLYEIVVDAILGTGITKPLEGLYAQVVATVNESRAFVLSVDIPSGMISDSVKAAPRCVWAETTVTFTAPKIAHILNEEIDALGDLVIVPIGSPPELLNRQEYYLNLITPETVRTALPLREPATHKGTYGHVAVLSGSSGKSGAAALSSYAALRTGSGLVTVYSPDAVQSLIAAYHPEIMTEGFESTGRGAFHSRAAEPVLERLKGLDAAGIGPGVTTEKETRNFVHSVVRNSPVPLVIDADALNCFEGETEKLANEQQAPLVITPHPGEFARLAGKTTGEVLEDPVELSRAFAADHALWVVFKNFRTLIASPEGEVRVSPLGNPGMATAGMGDVLTGILTSVLGQFHARGRMEPGDVLSALSVGVYLHGLAGDATAQSSGPEALAAGDVIDHLPAAFELLRRN